MKSRKPMVAGNWKMNKTLFEARDLIRAILPEVEGVDGVDIVVCPPFVSLGVTKRETEGSLIMIGAQNMHWEVEGAYTGEVAPSMVAELCQYVILGHSERRSYFGETDETVNLKTKAALAAGLTPIVCVGETLAEYEVGLTGEVVERQVRLGLAGLQLVENPSLVIAYEPVWAIGTGRASTAEDAALVIADIIRPAVAGLYGTEVAQAVRVLYGGSVKASNAAEFFAKLDIDGALVGGASLKAADFTAIVQASTR